MCPGPMGWSQPLAGGLCTRGSRRVGECIRAEPQPRTEPRAPAGPLLRTRPNHTEPLSPGPQPPPRAVLPGRGRPFPPPGLVPTAPDSGAPRACPATFRGGLCKHGVPPRRPPWALFILVPGDQGVGRGQGAGRIPATCPRTHPRGGPTQPCPWQRGGPPVSPRHAKGELLLLAFSRSPELHR